MIEAIYKDGNTSLKVKGTQNEVVHEFAAILKQLDMLEDIKPIAKALSKTITNNQIKAERQEEQSESEKYSELIEILNEIKKAVIEYACRK